MGQLIKLQDYTSRYEQNIFHYPSRFVVLSKTTMGKSQRNWEYPSEVSDLIDPYQFNEQQDDYKDKHSFVGKIKSLFQHRHKEDHIDILDEKESPSIDIDFFDVSLTTFHRPKTVEELKLQFLNQLFEFQMTWATSTLIDKSYVNKKYYYDEKLKFFLQRFPDTYLVLYNPVFKLKKATIEVDIILISPTDVWCITMVEEEDLMVYIGNNSKFWTQRSQNKEKKMVNPIISLNRMGKIVKKIFEISDVRMPIHKVLLSRNGYIDYPSHPYDIEIIDKRNYDEWFRLLRGLQSPLKAIQLKGADALLQFCSINSIKRIEWEVSDGK